MPPVNDPGLLWALSMLVLFEYINGFHDTPNGVATAVATEALSKQAGRWVSLIGNGLGALLAYQFGMSVAKVVGGDIVEPRLMTPAVISCALSGAAVWGLYTWWRGLPSSSSHALVGGLGGSALAFVGVSGVRWQGLSKVYVALVLSPLLGAILGSIAIRIINCLADRLGVSDGIFLHVQRFSAVAVSFAHGANDGMKSVGVMMLIFSTSTDLNSQSTSLVPHAVLISAVVLGLGSFAGSDRISHTMGHKIITLQPRHGMAAEMIAAGIINLATAFGWPSSTTHVVNGTIAGVGLGARLQIGWGKCREMGWAWLFTCPAAGLLAFILVRLTSPH